METVRLTKRFKYKEIVNYQIYYKGVKLHLWYVEHIDGVGYRILPKNINEVTNGIICKTFSSIDDVKKYLFSFLRTQKVREYGSNLNRFAELL